MIYSRGEVYVFGVRGHQVLCMLHTQSSRIMSPKTLPLSDNTHIPWIAFGTGTAFNRNSCEAACAIARSAGCTHIDTAARYGNEEDVGKAIAASGIPRESLYVTTKLYSIPPDGTVEGNLRTSLGKLQLDFVDLYLIHAPFLFLQRFGGLKQVWREMVEVKARGLARSIGVSNFSVKFLEEIMELGLEKPAVNQVLFVNTFVSTTFLNTERRWNTTFLLRAVSNLCSSSRGNTESGPLPGAHSDLYSLTRLMTPASWTFVPE